ncbi:unnamed protein product [Ectocarpus sp. CCAP 1310/34]|nr:unnamed protein product [Ectocarpus sp. CCAP 1310/34]
MFAVTGEVRKKITLFPNVGMPDIASV